MKKTLFTLFTILTIATSFAQNTKPKGFNYSIEIDPSTFFMRGYGVHLRLQPKSCDHLLFGIGAYALDLPDLLVDFNEKNKDKNWRVRIKSGVSLFAEHHFKKVNEKLFIGGQLGIQSFTIDKGESTNSSNYTNALAMFYVGYTFNPFDNNIYIKPWFGLGYTSKIDGENKVNNQTYNIAPLTYFATLHIGYTF